MPIEIIDADLELAELAVEIKVSHKVSFAGCFAAALTKHKKAEIYTGDPEFSFNHFFFLIAARPARPEARSQKPAGMETSRVAVQKIDAHIIPPSKISNITPLVIVCSSVLSVKGGKCYFYSSCWTKKKGTKEPVVAFVVTV